MNGSGQYDLSAVRSFDWTNLSLTKFSQFSESGTVEWRIGKGFGDWCERKGLVRKAIWIKAVELMGVLFYLFRKFGTEVSKFFFVSRVSSLEVVGFGSTAMAVDAALLGAWGVLLEELFSSSYMGCWGLEGGCSLFNFREISKFVVDRHVWEG